MVGEGEGSGDLTESAVNFGGAIPDGKADGLHAVTIVVPTAK